MNCLEFKAIRKRQNHWVLRRLVDLAALLILLRLFWLWLIWVLVIDSPLERFLFWRSSFLWLDWIGLGLVVAWFGIVVMRLWWMFLKSPRCPGCRARLLPQADLVMASGHCGFCGTQVIEDYDRAPVPPEGLLTPESLLTLVERVERRGLIMIFVAAAWLFLFLFLVPRFTSETVYDCRWLGQGIGIAGCFLIFWAGSRFSPWKCPCCGEPLGWSVDIRLTGHCTGCGARLLEPVQPSLPARMPLLSQQQLARSLNRLVWAHRVTWSLLLGGLMAMILFLIIINPLPLPFLMEILLWLGLVVWTILLGAWILVTDRWLGCKCPCCHLLLTRKTLPIGLATGRCSRCGGQIVAAGESKMENADTRN